MGSTVTSDVFLEEEEAALPIEATNRLFTSLQLFCKYDDLNQIYLTWANKNKPMQHYFNLQYLIILSIFLYNTSIYIFISKYSKSIKVKVLTFCYFNFRIPQDCRTQAQGMVEANSATHANTVKRYKNLLKDIFL